MAGEGMPTLAFGALRQPGEYSCRPFRIKRFELVPALMAPEPSDASNHWAAPFIVTPTNSIGSALLFLLNGSHFPLFVFASLFSFFKLFSKFFFG